MDWRVETTDTTKTCITLSISLPKMQRAWPVISENNGPRMYTAGQSLMTDFT